MSQAASLKDGNRFIPPQELSEGKRVYLGILQGRSDRGNDHVIVHSGPRFEDAPPVGHGTQRASEVIAGRHDGDVLEDAVVSDHLIAESLKGIGRTLDFKS